MKNLCVALLLLLSTPVLAGDELADNGIPYADYHQLDHFSWGHQSDVLHIAVGYGVAYTSAAIYKRLGVEPAWEAALLGTLTSIAISVLHETTQAYTSKTDLKTWSAGAITAGATFTVINF